MSVQALACLANGLAESPATRRVSEGAGQSRASREGATVAIEHPVASREGVEAKGRRYLVEGRLTVTTVDHCVRATCRGAGAVYELGWDAGSGWFCSCPARGRCAHLVALQLVTVRSEAS